MKMMRGSITRLLRKQGSGFILDQDGCELYFDRSGLNGLEFSSLSVGQWVEYQIQFGFERLRAVNIQSIRDKTGEPAKWDTNPARRDR